MKGITDNDAEITVECPTCNNEAMHQGNVEVYHRYDDAWDADGTHAVIDAYGVVHVDRNMRGCNSRRDEVRITITCERCSRPAVMQIVQDKGYTRIRWITA